MRHLLIVQRLNTLLKIAPNSQDAYRLKKYYDQVKQPKVKMG